MTTKWRITTIKLTVKTSSWRVVILPQSRLRAILSMRETETATIVTPKYLAIVVRIRIFSKFNKNFLLPFGSKT